MFLGHIWDSGVQPSLGTEHQGNEDRQTAHNLPEKVHSLPKILVKDGLAPKSNGEHETCFAFPYVRGSIISSPKLYIKSVMPSTLECVYI